MDSIKSALLWIVLVPLILIGQLIPRAWWDAFFKWNEARKRK